VAVTVTYATGRGHALIGRALYLPEGCAADEEHRELAGVPEEVLFATKPQLAGALLDRAHAAGIRAAFVAGDEVYGGRQLRRGIRQRGTSGRPDSRPRLAPDAHRVRDQGHPPLRLGDAAGGQRRHPPAAMVTGTASCWPAGTATPASCRITGAGRPGRSRCPS
jgi:DDE superfamily endonuclease